MAPSTRLIEEEISKSWHTKTLNKLLLPSSLLSTTSHMLCLESRHTKAPLAKRRATAFTYLMFSPPSITI